MTNTLKKIAFGGLLAGSLMITAVPAMARDFRWDHNYDRHYDRRELNGWHSNPDPRWDNGRWDYRGSRRDFDQLEQARQRALYDASHGASRKKIAQDDAVVDQMLEQMRYRR
jgi:hypothetical protein